MSHSTEVTLQETGVTPGAPKSSCPGRSCQHKARGQAAVQVEDLGGFGTCAGGTGEQHIKGGISSPQISTPSPIPSRCSKASASQISALSELKYLVKPAKTPRAGSRGWAGGDGEPGEGLGAGMVRREGCRKQLLGARAPCPDRVQLWGGSHGTSQLLLPPAAPKAVIKCRQTHN